MLKGSLIALQGTIIAQGIGFLLLPFLTRVYSPAEFAIYQLYMALLLPLVVLASLRYEVGLLSAREGGEERALLRLCLVLNVLLFSIVLVLSSVLALLRPGWLGSLTNILWLLPAGLLASGLMQTLVYVLLREQALMTNGIAKILQVTVFCLLGIAAAYTGFREFGLIGADVMGRLAAVLVIGVWLWRYHRQLFAAPHKGAIAAALGKFRNYPFFTVPGALLTVGITSLVPVIMLAAFGKSVMGQYVLVERALLLPAGLIGQAVAQAFTAQLSASIVEGKDVRRSFHRIILVMGGLGSIPALIVILFGPRLFEVIFGGQWTLAGQMAQVAGIWVLSSFAMAPVNMTLIVTSRQRQQLVWEVARLLLVAALWSGVIYFAITPIKAIALHAGLMAFMAAAFIWLADRALRDLPKSPAVGVSSTTLDT